MQRIVITSVKGSIVFYTNKVGNELDIEIWDKVKSNGWMLGLPGLKVTRANVDDESVNDWLREWG